MAQWDPKRKQFRTRKRNVSGELIEKRWPNGTPKNVVLAYELEIDLKRASGIYVPTKCPTLNEYLDRFFKLYPGIKRREQSSIIKHKSDLANHVQPVFGGMPLTHISASEILEWQANLHQDGEGLKAQTVRNIRGALSTVLMMAAIDRKFTGLSTNPVVGIPNVPSVTRGFSFWDAENSNRFLSYCIDEDHELFQLICFAVNTGMRPGELQGLKRDCIDFNNGYVDIRRTWCTKTNQLKERTKTGVPRKVSVPGPVLQMMGNRVGLQPHEFAFPLNFNSLGFRRLKPMAKRAGVEEIRFHDCRHSFASQLVMAGRTLIEVQELLGHIKYDSTLIYAHLTEKFKKGITDVLTDNITWARAKDCKVLPISGT